MYISRIRPRPGAEKRPVFWRILGDSYHAHRLVWGLFGDTSDRNRDFIYRQEFDDKRKLILYTVSTRPPEDREDLWSIETKPYAPKLSAGQFLYFTLRANPIRSKRDDQGRQHRHDVVMEAKRGLKEKIHPKKERPSQSWIVQDAGYEWLAARADKSGFAVAPGQVAVDGYRQHRFSKRKENVRLSTVDYNGRLTVTDTDRFTEMLATGLGSAKSFGCGLMLVKRA